MLIIVLALVGMGVVLVMWRIRSKGAVSAVQPHNNAPKAMQSRHAANWSSGKTVNVYVSKTSVGATPVYEVSTRTYPGATPVYVSKTSVGATPVYVLSTSIGAQPVYRVGGGPLR